VVGKEEIRKVSPVQGLANAPPSTSPPAPVRERGKAGGGDSTSIVEKRERNSKAVKVSKAPYTPFQLIVPGLLLVWVGDTSTLY
jgi:hypothetical protein